MELTDEQRAALDRHLPLHHDDLNDWCDITDRDGEYVGYFVPSAEILPAVLHHVNEFAVVERERDLALRALRLAAKQHHAAVELGVDFVVAHFMAEARQQIGEGR